MQGHPFLSFSAFTRLEGDYEELIDVALAKRDVKAAAFWYKSAKELALPTEAALL